MVALRSRRLDSLFGAQLDQLTDLHIRSLVANSVAEAFDLDFKQELYRNTDADRRSLAGDVAAMANTAGGVLILGLQEDEQAVAKDAPGVDLSDAEQQRMRQIVASLVAPMPMFDIITVPDVGSTTHGYYVIAIPRSPSAPHAVLVNDGLRYPKRNGSTTRYLSEPEVAAAYRDRLAGVEAQTGRIALVEADASARIDLDMDTWVMVTMVPDLAGSLDITYALQQEFQAQTVGQSTLDIVGGGYTTFQRTRVGSRRLLADGGSHGSTKATWASADYHSDGSGAYSHALPDLLQRRRAESEPPESNTQVVDDESIVIGVLTGLRRLALHARDRTAAGGNALVRASLLPRLGWPLEIGHTRGWGSGESRSGVALQLASVAAETVASIDDLAAAGPELVSVAAGLVDELGQAFDIAEMGQLTREGEIRVRYWNHPWQERVKEWAEQHGVAVTDQTLGD
ncbi:MAG: ATP-binding protein [Gammaproteobacteria bacterium]